MKEVINVIRVSAVRAIGLFLKKISHNIFKNDTAVTNSRSWKLFA